jgi:exonuclease III
MKLDILGLSEVRKHGEAIVEKPDGDILSYTGETKGQYGVGFIIKKKLKHSITEIRGISERIAVLSLNINGNSIAVIQMYAPTEASTEDKIEKFYDLLDDTLINYKADRTFVMGDFNSKVGSKEFEDEPMGSYGYGERNERGDRLIQFVQGQRVKVINTFYKKNWNSRWTWLAPNGKTKNEIDFILANKLEGIKDIQVINGLKFTTDHRLVRLNLQIMKRRRPYFKAAKIKPEQINHTKFAETLKKNLDELHQLAGPSVQNHYNQLGKCIMYAVRTCLSTKVLRKNSKGELVWHGNDSGL